MTVHVIFGGCSFTQIYNSYANLIALANVPEDPEERRSYLNEIGFNRLQVQWQLYTSKFHNHRIFQQFIKDYDLEDYSHNIEEVVKKVFPRKKDYKFYNVAQGGGGNKLNTYCVMKAINYLRRHYPDDEIKVFYNNTSFDRVDKIITEESPDYDSFVRRQKETTKSSVWSTLPHFNDKQWNFSADTQGGFANFSKHKTLSGAEHIDKRCWVKFGNIDNDPQVFRLDPTDNYGRWDMSGWFKQNQLHSNSEDQAVDNATWINALMDHCETNNIYCKTYFGWNTGLGSTRLHGYAKESLDYLKTHNNFINFSKGTTGQEYHPFLGFKDWVISQFGYDIAGHQQFDTQGPFEIIVQIVANEVSTHPDRDELLRKCRSNSCKTTVRGMNYVDYDEWNKKLVWNELGPDDVVDPRTYFDAQEIDGHPGILTHLIFGKLLYDTMI